MKFCNSTLLLINGIWQFLGSNLIQDPWRECPKLYSNQSLYFTDINSTKIIQDHHEKYSCQNNHSYTKATYQPLNCNIINPKHGLSYIASHTFSGSKDTKPKNILIPMKPHILYVGDSLIGQSFISAACMVEQYHFENKVEVSYAQDFFLRHDIPCDPQCLDNEKFFNESLKIELFSPCTGCPERRKRSFDDFPTYKHSWMKAIKSNTKAIILGAGAWYNAYKGIFNSTLMFEDTILKIKPYLRNYLKQGIEIFWIGLPPMNKALLGKKEFEWIQFKDKDELIKTHLIPLGVNFIDSTKILEQWYDYDSNIKSDQLHWW